MYDFIIIGAGMSGVAFARCLQLAGINNFIILESNDEPGGLCRTKYINGHHLDIGGGHFLCTKFPEVDKFISDHIAKDDMNLFDRVSQVEVNDRFIDYPLEYNLWQLPSDIYKKYLDSLSVQSSIICPKNYREYIESNMGSMIAENYMIPYNTKLWGVDPCEMDVDWLNKIPPFDKNKILQSKSNDKSVMPSHASFYYPKKGGFQTIFDAICNPVREKIQFNSAPRNIKHEDGTVYVDQYACKYLINTAPWNNIKDALCPCESISCHFDNLKASSLVVSLSELDYSHNWHWAYRPSLSLNHHREFFIHNFASHSKKNGVYFETNLKRYADRTSVLYKHINDFAYPIPTIGNAQSIKQILSYYAEQNIIGLGRWGQWKYFNSDVCIGEAMTLASQVINL